MSHLTISYLRQENRPFLQDRLFYIPQHDREHFEQFPLLPADKKVAIEYCSGNGQWILERSLKDPSIFWVAVEKKWMRARKIWQKMSKMNLENLLVVYAEALTFTLHYLPDQSVSEIFVNFPDPWPKRRHGKHRLIQKKFVNELSRVLKIGGTATLVTDDPGYCELSAQEMCACAAFQSSFPAPYYITDWPAYGSSFFERLWRDKGKFIRYMQFVKTI